MKKWLFIKMIVVSFAVYACSNSDEPGVTDSPVKGSCYNLNKSDSLAMIAIYEKIGPWGQEWDLHNVKTWAGVTLGGGTTGDELRIVEFNYFGSFHGTIPEEFLQLSELRFLGLGGGNLTGEIPAWIGNMKKLEGLYIGFNSIQGQIPPEIGQLANLKTLYLMKNALSGEIPPEIGNLKKLERLCIGGTGIGGEIPVELKDLESIEILDLHGNEFTGRFPIEIIGDYCIDCSRNQITELPLEVWEMGDCGFPNLQYNNLSGELPEWVFKTEGWKRFSGFVARQNEGYGYSNFVDGDTLR